MDFNSSVTNLSEEQLDFLFDDKTPAVAATPTADDLKVGVDPDDKTPESAKQLSQDIPIIDNIDDLDDDKSGEDNDSKKDDKVPEVKVDGKTQSEILKNTFKYLVDKGEWKDIEGSDELEFTDEIYAELSQKQAQAKVEELFTELLDSTGDYGKAIITHIKSGGNPDEIIDIFKEQKAVQNFDIKEDINQKQLVEKYYSEIVGWNKNKVDKFINSLEGEDGGLEEEAKEAKLKFDEIYTNQIKEIKAQQALKQQQATEAQKEYINNLSKEVDQFEGFTEDDKKLIKNSALKFNKKLADGTQVSDFYIKFQQMQQNPKEYIKLVHFVVDPQGYEKRVRAAEEKKAVQKSWNFIKGNSAVSSKNNNTPEVPDEKYSKISFKFK